jgi:hypothetical protein
LLPTGKTSPVLGLDQAVLKVVHKQHVRFYRVKQDHEECEYQPS